MHTIVRCNTGVEIYLARGDVKLQNCELGLRHKQVAYMRPRLFKTRNFHRLPVNQLTGQDNHHAHEVNAKTYPYLETLLI